MKQFLLTIFSLPMLALIIAFIGYSSSSSKNKLKFYSLSLALFFFTSLPLTSFLLSYPLTNFADKFEGSNYSNISAILVLTGGIKKNVAGEWIPSNETYRRALIAKKISESNYLPIIISGGKTSNKDKSESLITKEYLKFNEITLEQSSINTYESVLNLKKYCLVQKEPFLLIAGNYHSLRSYLTFISNGCKIKTYKYDRYFSYSLLIPSTEGFSKFNQVSYEILALIYYLSTNKIKII